MVLIDACVRLLPGVVGAAGSLEQESFEAGLLEYPQYTKPREWEGRAIPEVLLSGDHKKIADWRRAEAERLTASAAPTCSPAPSGRLSASRPHRNPGKSISTRGFISAITPGNSPMLAAGVPATGAGPTRLFLSLRCPMSIILELDREQMAAVTMKRAVPEFGPGDTVRVMVKVIEGDNLRTQAYEGVVIGRSGAGVNENFTVRKISYGEGVERVFPVYSPYIAEIEVLRRGKVRRAKLYYLRGRRGKSARIPERSDARARRLNAQWKGFKKQKGEPDDLTQIKGIDADLAARLRQLNCMKLEQIANLSDDDMANIDETLQLNGRIEKDDWIEQAQALIAEAAAAEVPAEEAEQKG